MSKYRETTTKYLKGGRMVWLKSDSEQPLEVASQLELFVSDSAFSNLFEKTKKWLNRFPHSLDISVFTDLCLLQLLTTEKYRALHLPSHLFRLVLCLHLMQKKLVHTVTCLPDVRHLEIRWIPTALQLAGSCKPVLGCLIGFNELNRYEVFDEENIFLALRKLLPGVKLIEGSSYRHASPHRNLTLFYFEVERGDEILLSTLRREVAEGSLKEKIKNSIQMLSPAIFMGFNEEEHYKHMLVLGQEIRTLHDVSQAYITFEEQTGREVTFRIVLVYVLPSPNFSLKKCFFNCSFVSERVSIVKHIANHPIEAQIFCLRIPRDHSILRSDGSLDFYAARKKVVDLIRRAIGEFRDYNGGIIIQRQTLLNSCKEHFPECIAKDPELLDSFFYAITPVEKQILLTGSTLRLLFAYFLKAKEQELPAIGFSIDHYHHENDIFLVAVGRLAAFKETVSEVIQEVSFTSNDVAYTFVETAGMGFFTCVFINPDFKAVETFVIRLGLALERLYHKNKQRQVLHIGMEYSCFSLDPRVGGDTRSCDILKLLFEGLTRFDQNGHVGGAIAQEIDISADLKEYTFKLRPSLWNDGTPLTAYDFEYAWKSILTPGFATAFDFLFYPIKNAREVKLGNLPMSELGVHVIDEHTLKVELSNPIPYFLQLTALPIYSPVQRLKDKKFPNWPDQCELDYPCNGPFLLNINRPHQGYQLVKNPFYWDSAYLALDQITMTLINPSQAVQAFKRGELDWIGNPLGEWYPFFHHGNEEKVLSFKNAGVSYCLFNTHSFPFHNQKLRLAISYAINRAEINNKAFLHLASAYSPLLPHIREMNEPVFPEYNEKEARRLFQEGLDEMKITVKDIPQLRIVVQEKGIRECIAEFLAQQIQNCFGIQCLVESFPRHLYVKGLAGREFHIGLMVWNSLMDDPYYTLGVFKYAYHGINFSRWEHPSFQQALDLRDQVVNPLQRSHALLKAEKILSQQAPIIPLFYHPSLSLVRTELQANYKAPGGRFNLAKSYYQKGEL